MVRRGRGGGGGYHDTQQVCRSGHQITDRYKSKPNRRKDHCPHCGAETIYQCEECGTEIEGDYVSQRPSLVSSETPVPSHCDSCGAEFPWADQEGDTPEEAAEGPDELSILQQVFERFHIIARQLRDRYNDRETLDVTDEYDVQDLLHALLRLFFNDIRPEEWTPSYAGQSARVDFLLKNEFTVIETKMAREGLTAGDIGNQLIIDIERYQSHPDCDTLVCFVYDPMGKIGNPAGLEQDLSREEEELDVEVYVTPKGL